MRLTTTSHRPGLRHSIDRPQRPRLTTAPLLRPLQRLKSPMTGQMILPPHFNPTTRSLCFMVQIGPDAVPAYFSESSWQARHGESDDQASLHEIYLQNRTAIDAAVIRKVEAGSRTPVILRVSDL